MEKIDITLILIFIVSLFALGWVSNNLYQSYNQERILNGLWLKNYNYTEAQETAYSLDKQGDWIMINTRRMTYPEAYDTCVHECSHKAYSEIFAEQCEKDFSKCRRLMNETKENI